MYGIKWHIWSNYICNICIEYSIGLFEGNRFILGVSGFFEAFLHKASVVPSSERSRVVAVKAPSFLSLLFSRSGTMSTPDNTHEYYEGVGKSDTRAARL
jgi:hypothetical protein